ncbi:universal stress protein [Halovivax sp.]|uniref:universal stress protein n=1 Tax=Halovivax sp. TaxID=1935978 RepID=UPI0025C4D0AE|nr:universal stress protein [Halovivax sp.]
MAPRILLPYDGSKPARDAIRYSFDTFDDPRVTALHVIPLADNYWTVFEGMEARVPNYDEAVEHAEALFDEAASIAAETDGRDETENETGEPERTIIERGEAGEFDLIVIGRHGRVGLSRMLLGSTAEKVVRRSPTPVLVVR